MILPKFLLSQELLKWSLAERGSSSKVLVAHILAKDDFVGDSFSGASS
jgi:hypothetical protein